MLLPRGSLSVCTPTLMSSVESLSVSRQIIRPRVSQIKLCKGSCAPSKVEGGGVQGLEFIRCTHNIIFIILVAINSNNDSLNKKWTYNIMQNAELLFIQDETMIMTNP